HGLPFIGATAVRVVTKPSIDTTHTLCPHNPEGGCGDVSDGVVTGPGRVTTWICALASSFSPHRNGDNILPEHSYEAYVPLSGSGTLQAHSGTSRGHTKGLARSSRTDVPNSMLSFAMEVSGFAVGRRLHPDHPGLVLDGDDAFAGGDELVIGSWFCVFDQPPGEQSFQLIGCSGELD